VTANAPVFRIEVDSDRDGTLEPGEPGRWDWNFGPGEVGAVALTDAGQNGNEPELTPARLTIESLPDQTALTLGINATAMPFVTVYAQPSGAAAQPVVGRLPDKSLVQVAGPFTDTIDLFVQPRQLPGLGFDGVVELTAQLVVVRNGKLVPGGPTDRAALRVAPWIMTPNNCEPERVYVVALPSGDATGNAQFIVDLQKVCGEAGVELLQIDATELTDDPDGRYDHWIQDEIEFGYVERPGRVAAIVVDGPRNRGLDTVGPSGQLGKGVGAVLLDADFDVAGNLDAFGNLEVSPPVKVGHKNYPLGRIVLGTRPPGDDAGEQASLRLRQFLYDQRVQSPFEIVTDWLAVGHVDEVISFVPAPSERGFVVAVASPRRAREIFEAAKAADLGDAMLWRGQRLSPWEGKPRDAEETVSELLGKDALWAYNRECEQHIADVVATCEVELGLGKEDFVQIPVLFEDDGGAAAYFPDMVNHLVLGPISVVPKPYGPLDSDGNDLLERAFCDALPHRTVRFIDDWLTYHKRSGEVHCGTNTLRKEIEGVNWWEHKYDGFYPLRAE
jgi:protein-arginine deiminase